MPINEQINPNSISAIATPTNGVSDVMVEGGQPGGHILLEAQIPGTPIWVYVTDQSGAFTIATPDQSINYRFRATNIKEPVHVYFGP